MPRPNPLPDGAIKQWYGDRLMHRWQLQRFRYLEPKSALQEWLDRQKQRESRKRLAGDAYEGPSPYNDPRDPQPRADAPAIPGLWTDYRNPQLKWAPRDSLENPCLTLADWLSHGYGEYELPLSLMGHDSRKADFKELKRFNHFIASGYTYLHLPFAHLAEFIQQLHAEDRFLCYIIPEGVPVHMYFDLDGDFAQFPHLVGQDEACLQEFLSEVRQFFLELFARPMDCSGLVLLQATSAVKLSWHLHVQSEAFRDVYHLQEFVKRLNVRLRRKAEENSTSTLLHHQGKPIVDHVPYMKNQNFRVPYNRKPGKTPLLPRAFVLDGDQLHLAPSSWDDVVNAELLWKCHPALAQPGAGYEYMQLELSSAAANKRARALDKLTTTNRDKKLKVRLAANQSEISVQAGPRLGKVPEADPATMRALTSEETSFVLSVLQPHLGNQVNLYTAAWYRTSRSGEIRISGVCAKGSAYCLHQTKMLGRPYTHSSNTMTFTMRRREITFRCFKCDVRMPGAETSRPPSHHCRWNMDANGRALMGLTSLHGEAAMEESSTTMSVSPAEAQHVDLSELDPAATMLDAAEADHVELVELPPVQLDHVERLIQYIRQAHPKPSRRAHAPAGTDIQGSLALFQQHVVGSEVQLVRGQKLMLSPQELFRRYFAFNKAMQAVERVPAWKSVLEVSPTAKYLDPTSNGELSRLFQNESHVVIHAPVGTGKTDLIAAELARRKRENPNLRVLYLSIRTAFCDTLVKRLAKFDEQVGVPAGVELGFRSYREKAFHRGRKHDSFRAKQADRALVQCPSLIISLESLHRLASARSLEGVLLVPQYDVLVMDEIMESHAIFHGSTMEEKRRISSELLQSIASNVKSVIGADADIKDWVVLPFLQDLTNGQAFVKVSHQAKTLPRRYVHYSEHAHWRKELLNALRAGKKIVVACNIKKEVLSIINDPDIVALGLPMQAVHQESTGEERQAYVAQVSNWSSLSLFVYSPVISSGVDFNLEHFDQAFWFASDNSTTARQAFQQLNRVRKLKENVVHTFFSLHAAQHAHLSCTMEEIKEQLDERVREHHGDSFVHSITQLRTSQSASSSKAGVGPLRPSKDYVSCMPDDQGSGSLACTFTLDVGVQPGNYVRQLFDTAGNRMFLRNQVQINQSRVNFRKELYETIEQTGGTIEAVLPTEVPADCAAYKTQLKEIAEEDKSRHLQAVMAAPDLCGDELQALHERRRRHATVAGDAEIATKAQWKETYGIPLENSTRLGEVDDFAGRFSATKRLEQARNIREHLNERCPMDSAAARVTATSDPVAYLLADADVRSYTTLVLQSVGFDSLVSAVSVANVDREERLVPGSAERISLLSRWEKVSWCHSGWWKAWKEKHRWSMDKEADHDLHQPDGSAVTASQLHQAWLTGARQFLSARYGVKIASGRFGRAHGRSQYIQLDRSHWNEWSEHLFGLPPQEGVTLPKVRRLQLQASGPKGKRVKQASAPVQLQTPVIAPNQVIAIEQPEIRAYGPAAPVATIPPRMSRQI